MLTHNQASQQNTTEIESLIDHLVIIGNEPGGQVTMPTSNNNINNNLSLNNNLNSNNNNNNMNNNSNIMHAAAFSFNHSIGNTTISNSSVFNSNFNENASNGNNVNNNNIMNKQQHNNGNSSAKTLTQQQARVKNKFDIYLPNIWVINDDRSGN